MSNGLVLVFDLDQTLIDSTDILKEKVNNWATIEDFIQRNINMRIVENILRPAVGLRKTGKVAAIILLTNNSLTAYVDRVNYYIAKHLGIPDITAFDYTMMRQDRMRKQPSINPPKGLNDVKNILLKLNKPDDDLARRTIMFDDCDRHLMKKELCDAGYPRNYIQVIGPEDLEINFYEYINRGFLAGKNDLTDYRFILELFSQASAQDASAQDPSAEEATAEEASALDSIPTVCNNSTEIYSF